MFLCLLLHRCWSGSTSVVRSWWPSSRGARCSSGCPPTHSAVCERWSSPWSWPRCVRHAHLFSLSHPHTRTRTHTLPLSLPLSLLLSCSLYHLSCAHAPHLVFLSVTLEADTMPPPLHPHPYPPSVPRAQDLARHITLVGAIKSAARLAAEPAAGALCHPLPLLLA